jgi:pyrroloquinoline quinone biosynthesis protein B
MIVRVLGSAAGGGVPQWNCACANCRAARAGLRPRRSSSSFAVSGDGARWWLVNVSPDVAQQIEAFAPLQPQHGRGTPIAGMLLTDANVDHIGGFAVLRQAGDHAFTTYSTPAVKRAATEQAAFAPFAEAPHRWETFAPGDRFELPGGLRVRSVPLDGLMPGYAGRRALPDAVTGYLIADAASGAGALFAPVFANASESLLAAARLAAIAFFDGSFWSDDELDGVGVEKSARALGHAPIGGADGTLAALSGLPPGGRRFFAHLNNTNPLLDPRSEPARELARSGLELAEDGLEFRL